MNKKLFVGIDFSKETFDAAILKVSEESSIDLKIIGNEQFKNDVPGCKRFVKWLNKTCALSVSYTHLDVYKRQPTHPQCEASQHTHHPQSYQSGTR